MMQSWKFRRIFRVRLIFVLFLCYFRQGFITAMFVFGLHVKLFMRLCDGSEISSFKFAFEVLAFLKITGDSFNRKFL